MHSADWQREVDDEPLEIQVSATIKAGTTLVLRERNSIAAA